MALLAGGALLAASTVSVAANDRAPAGGLYALDTVRFMLRADDPIGKKRSGAICLPAGTLHWREARPDPADARDAIEDGLKQEGLALAATSQQFVDRRQPLRIISGRVIGLRLNACLPPSGLGRLINRSRTIKGDGAIDIEWSLVDSGDAAAPRQMRRCTTFTFDDLPMPLTEAVLAGLRDGAKAYARSLGTADAGPAATPTACGPTG